MSDEREKTRKDSGLAAELAGRVEAEVKGEVESREKAGELMHQLRELRKEEKVRNVETDRLRSEWREKEGELCECSSEVERVHSDLKECRATIANSDEKIPQLEEVKKAAVAQKNFKDAAKVSSEIKLLQDKKGQSESSIVDLEGALTSAEARRDELKVVVGRVTDELASAEADYQSRER